jgi:hypothetical protein
MRRNYTAREILNMPKNEIWELPQGGLVITYDDGEVRKHKTTETILSSYFWRFSAVFPGLVLTSDLHLNGRPFNTKNQLLLCGLVLWRTFFAAHPDWLNGEGRDEFWRMSEWVYGIMNEIHNDTTSMLGNKIVSFDLSDIVEVLKDKDIIKAKETGTGRSISEINDEVNDLLESGGADGTKFPNIRREMKYGNFKRREMGQLFGHRGYVPDINGKTPVTPIERGYAEGFNSLYDQLVASRSASFSLYMQTGPLEDSEYNNRFSQLGAGVISKITWGDCGTTDTVSVKITVRNRHKMMGKKIVHPDGSQEILFDYSTLKIGSRYNFRSFTKCASKVASEPCSHCVGLTSILVPPKTNLGSFLILEALAEASQEILSVKHVLASTTVAKLLISKLHSHLIYLDPDENLNIHLKKALSEGGWSIRFDPYELSNVNDITAVYNINDIDYNALTRVNSIDLVKIVDDVMVESHSVPLLVGGKGISLSPEFLQFMRITGWDNIGKQITVNLKDWVHVLPFAIAERRGEFMGETLANLRRFTRGENSKGVTCKSITDYNDMGQTASLSAIDLALEEIEDVLKTLNVSFIHHEIFVKVLMAKGTRTCELPLPGDNFRFITMFEAIKGRGIGASFGFQKQAGEIIENPRSYLREKEKVPGHHLDYRWT